MLEDFYIRPLTQEDLEDDLINKEDFSEVIYLDSDNFRLSDRYTKDYYWYGLFDSDSDDIISVLAIYYEKGSEECELALFETKENERDKGYGSKLLQYALDIYSKKCKSIHLNGMYKDLDKYYERFGFYTTSTNSMLKMNKIFD